MDHKCIPANPDISGIGVRAAIYAQNLLCFAPVVAHLWDGNVSADEMKGVKDQSIGMLAIAFAILISTIIGAANVRSGQIVTSFHAAVILDLSWMNNTSTWIWFLLYAHHLTKPSERKERIGESKPIPATWSDWKGVLLSPLRRLVKGTGDAEKGVSGGRRHTDGNTRMMDIWQSVFQRAWYFVSEKPVLTLGSIHLSLMGTIGLWLWSNPSKFDTPIGPCLESVMPTSGDDSSISSIQFAALQTRLKTFAEQYDVLPVLCKAFRNQSLLYFGGDTVHLSIWSLAPRVLILLLDILVLRNLL
ncbi:hypothetical protein B0H14DRAFT_3520018 [Mycena olivaceomarginata]|nr:hypothetical protein B0H14DRAFT_3520018 [Mycena olivaceomarginata]